MEKMTIKAWLEQATTSINRLDAELLLVHILKASDRSYLTAHAEDEIPNLDALNVLLKRRQKGEPLAYIIGYREFYGRNFAVTPDTLIPRPETEDIIEIAKSIKPAKILDVGTGSGCIAITLALELPTAEVAAVDIFTSTLEVAQKNASHFGAKVAFYKSNLLSDFQPEPETLIIANLPYVDKNWDWLDQNTLRHEPESALYAEQGGLALIYKLIDQYPTDAAGLILEADPSQHERIIEYAKSHSLNLKKQVGFILLFN